MSYAWDLMYHVGSSLNHRMTSDELNYYIRVDVPGFNKNNLNVSVSENKLSVFGESNKDSDKKVDVYFILGNGVDRNKTNATVVDGVLTVTLPRSRYKTNQPIKIDVE